MLKNPRKTLGIKKNMVYKIPPGRGGKPYPASGLLVLLLMIRCLLSFPLFVWVLFLALVLLFITLWPSSFAITWIGKRWLFALL